MEILPPPATGAEDCRTMRCPTPTHGFDPDTRRPLNWPMRLTAVHWAGVHPGLAPGKYTLRCRAVDEKGHGQPMPRPFRKSGHAAIEQVVITVK